MIEYGPGRIVEAPKNRIWIVGGVMPGVYVLAGAALSVS